MMILGSSFDPFGEDRCDIILGFHGNTFNYTDVSVFSSCRVVRKPAQRPSPSSYLGGTANSKWSDFVADVLRN